MHNSYILYFKNLENSQKNMCFCVNLTWDGLPPDLPLEKNSRVAGRILFFVPWILISAPKA